jgi:sulfate/thiosulfate transport system permease protein
VAAAAHGAERLMAAAQPRKRESDRPGANSIVSRALRATIISISVLFVLVLLVLPLTTVFVEALSKGVAAYMGSFADPDTLAAIRLTLTTAAIVVPLNTIFGIAAAYAIARFEFRGKNLLTTLIELPFAISPVISGLIYVLLFGANGWFGAWLEANNISIVFAFPGIVLATMFVTFPYVARELLPLMQMLGTDEEEAAISLGGGPWTTFFRVTLPKIQWGVVYGVILCNARAMGEFGAVAVVSGHIRGLTTTMPLHVEILYNEYNYVGAFAVASLLSLLAVVTVIIKTALEWRAASRHS